MKRRLLTQAKYLGVILLSALILGSATALSFNMIAITISPDIPLINPFNAYALLIFVGFLTTKPQDMRSVNMSMQQMLMFSMQSAIYTVSFSVIALTYWYFTNPQ